MDGKELYGTWSDELEDHPTDLGGVAFDELPETERLAWERLAARAEVAEKPKPEIWGNWPQDGPAACRVDMLQEALAAACDGGLGERLVFVHSAGPDGPQPLLRALEDEDGDFLLTAEAPATD